MTGGRDFLGDRRWQVADRCQRPRGVNRLLILTRYWEAMCDFWGIVRPPQERARRARGQGWHLVSPLMGQVRSSGAQTEKARNHVAFGFARFFDQARKATYRALDFIPI